MPDAATSTDTFALIYEGDDLNSGEMDVFDLAPALLAVGETFKAADEALNGSGSIVTTSVHADFRKGSFEITLSVHQHLKDGAATLLPTLQATGAGQLIATVIGAVKDSLIEKAKEKSLETITGLFKLIGRLGGETPKDIRYDESTHSSIFVFGSNNQIHVDQPTTNLYRDQRTRAAVDKVARPLRKAGVTTLKAKKNEELLASVGQSDFPELEHDDRSALSIPEPEAPQTLIVRIVKPDFTGDKWSVSEGGRRAYTVTMEDEVFKRRVHAREIGFFDGDMYRVKMLTSQNIDGRGLTTSRKIIEVIEPVPRPRQQLLPSPPPEKPGRKLRDE